jgi:hypothetical protein
MYHLIACVRVNCSSRVVHAFHLCRPSLSARPPVLVTAAEFVNSGHPCD